MNISDDLINNDVPADGQIDGGDVLFDISPDATIKIAFLGNSITRHGVNKDLGWYGDHGMAASCEQNDYVHRVIKMTESVCGPVSYCVANLSEWERRGDLNMLKTRYAAVKRFDANIIVVRLGENARLTYRLDEFKLRYAELVDHFCRDGVGIILTDLFWKYEPFDSFVKNLACKKGCSFVRLHDLGDDDGMKALGKFEHAGVCMHPGDRGMAEIAERIFAAVKQLLHRT